jgi:tol-pal system protein YbgF
MRRVSIQHHRNRAATRGARRGSPALRILAVAVLASLGGCTPPQLLTLRSGLDSLRVVVDTLTVRDSLAFQVVRETRRELAEQRDIVLSTRATAGSTTQELFEQMQRLEGKLDEVMGRFQQQSQRQNATPTTPGGADPNQLYDQAAQDLTQGRYPMALAGFREFVQRFPNLELTDNAQYGIGECLFAESQFDSAATAYAQVDSLYPTGDKAPAALYKRALAEEKLGRMGPSRQHLQELIRRFPLAGESQLARERLGTRR